jgi:hypothetical protein
MQRDPIVSSPVPASATTGIRRSVCFCRSCLDRNFATCADRDTKAKGVEADAERSIRPLPLWSDQVLKDGLRSLDGYVSEQCLRDASIRECEIRFPCSAFFPHFAFAGYTLTGFVYGEYHSLRELGRAAPPSQYVAFK